MKPAKAAARNRTRIRIGAAAKPGSLGFAAALAVYLFLYWPVLVARFGDGAPLIAASVGGTTIIWYLLAVGRSDRAIYLWALLAPMAGASLGYLFLSLLFLLKHGQFVAGFGFGQWLPNVLVMAGFSARAWILSFMLVVWATILYVARPANKPAT